MVTSFRGSTPLIQEFPQIKLIQDIARRKKIKIYLVGGFLRDRYLGRPSFDLDFAVEHRSISLAKSFSRLIKGAFVLLDKENGCARVVKKINGKPFIFDFADFRAATLTGDLSHRDFTINTLAIDILSLNENTYWQDILLDKKGARDDIEKRLIRMTGKGVFREDPLRMMRAFSLYANLVTEFGFKIDQEVLASIKKDARLIRTVSAERVREELFKIFDTVAAAQVINQMDKYGMLEYVIPQITVMRGCAQGGYHHLDVWKHSLETLSQVNNVVNDLSADEDTQAFIHEKISGNHSRLSLIRIAAFLHDIGKPAVRKIEAGRKIFHGHEHAGKDIVRHIARQLKFSTEERYMIEDMVEMHLRPGYLANFKRPTEKAIYRFFRSAKDSTVNILILSLADQRATRGPETTEEDIAHHEKISLDVLKRYWKMKKTVPAKRLLTGDDLINTLKLIPSPIFSTILSSIDEMQALGKISTKEQALNQAKELISKITPNNSKKNTKK